MTEINKIQSLYFSPTGNTKKIVDAISIGTGLPSSVSIDLTLSKQRESWSGLIEGDVLIVGVPVYAGSFPSLILPYLERLKGEDRWAIPVAVCGNAQMRTCLSDLSGVLKKQGFKIVAAANFIGQHSFYTKDFPLGKGRPDKRDLKIAYSFGKEVIAKLRSTPSDITSIRGGNIWLRVYLTSSIDSKGSVFPVTLHSAIRVSEFDKTRCNNCNKCVESCPTGAIDPLTLKVNDETCIRCFACTEVCQNKTRKKIVEPEQGLSEWFKKQASKRAEPQFIL